MKGAFSSPEGVLDRYTQNTLYPDTCYTHESGGAPEVIPELTYEDFLNFHKTYYHPSNSYIYLYGNMDMAEKLEFIDRHYLSAFGSLDVDSEIREQKAFAAMQDLTKEYPVAESESEEDNAYLSYNVVVGTAMDSLTAIAFEVLDYALLSAPGAPLKKALLDAGIGKDIYGAYEDGIRQPYFDIIAKGANADKKEEFVSIIRGVLQKVAETGIDLLAAGIGNIHGKYPENWAGLSFETLEAVRKATGHLPLVLHGGTGIPADMIKKAISLGVAKINVNTECQLAFAAATRKYIEEGKDEQGKGYDPRKLLAPGFEAIKATVKEKMELFGSVDKA